MKTGVKQTAWIFLLVITVLSICTWFQILLGVGLIVPRRTSTAESPFKLPQNMHTFFVTKTAAADRLCREHLITKSNIYESGYLMKNNSIYYCNIPKCGSTFMGMFLRKLFSEENNSDFMSKIDIPQMIKDAYAFMFVREPYRRLFAAYENKFFHPSEMWTSLGSEVIREVRNNVSSTSKRLGHDVSFRELVEYVVKLHEHGWQLNLHLAPMHTICNPCKHTFNYIGTLETMTEDLKHLTDEWKLRGFVSMKAKTTEHMELETKYIRSFGRINHLFWAVKEYEYLPTYKMFQRNWSSYQMRGIILKKYEMPFHDIMASRITKELYKKAVSMAMDESYKYVSELKFQREEALIQAYRTVPLHLLNKFRNVVKLDCLLFGYDDRPEIIFNRSAKFKLSGHNYFNGL